MSPPAGPTAAEVRLRVVPTAVAPPTDVRIGDGLLAALDAAVSEALPRARRRLVVADAGLAADAVRAAWSGPFLAGEDVLLVPAGEDAKSREVHARLEDEILARGLTRDDVVVGLGGGAVLDATGYAAATVRRGTPWVAVPTSVVGIVDASVGGKTAIDHPRGKNLLGAFHPPALVVADVRPLGALPARDFTAGLAEVWKAGVVGDPGLLDLLRAGVPRGAAGLVDTFARAVRVKIALVEADERDVGVRRGLNYGHTVGHALETALGPEAMRHGEGVAIGMGVATEVAARRGLVPPAFLARQDADLAALGLPTRLPRGVVASRVLDLVGADKKRRAGGAHTMVLPRAGGGVVVAEDVRDAELEAALDARRAPE